MYLEMLWLLVVVDDDDTYCLGCVSSCVCPWMYITISIHLQFCAAHIDLRVLEICSFVFLTQANAEL